MLAKSWSILHKTVYCARVEDSSLNIATTFHDSPNSLSWIEDLNSNSPGIVPPSPLVKYKSIHSKNYTLGAQNRRLHEHARIHTHAQRFLMESLKTAHTCVHTYEHSWWSQWRDPDWFCLHQGTRDDHTIIIINRLPHQLSMIKITWQAWNTNTSSSLKKTTRKFNFPPLSWRPATHFKHRHKNGDFLKTEFSQSIETLFGIHSHVTRQESQRMDSLRHSEKQPCNNDEYWARFYCSSDLCCSLLHTLKIGYFFITQVKVLLCQCQTQKLLQLSKFLASSGWRDLPGEGCKPRTWCPRHRCQLVCYFAAYTAHKDPDLKQLRKHFNLRDSL